MEEQRRYRHELKYNISYADYLSLRMRLRQVMQPDPNVNADGKYLIRSIYFDNYRDKALREKINGAAKREKFRIRYYNDDLSFLTLEKKMKVNDLCMKIDAPVTLEECRKLLSGERNWMLDHAEPLVKELYVKMKSDMLRPRIMVSYTREPYIYRAGNVRITFDSNIRSTLYHQSFLEPVSADVNVEDSPGRMILEVKFDDFLPEIIAHLIQTNGCRQEAFSKYGACRRFG